MVTSAIKDKLLGIELSELVLCLDESKIDLGSTRLALQRDTLGFTRVKLSVCAAFFSGTGVRSRNSQTCTTRFHISELGNLVQMFRLTNHSYWDSCLR